MAMKYDWRDATVNTVDRLNLNRGDKRSVKQAVLRPGFKTWRLWRLPPPADLPQAEKLPLRCFLRKPVSCRSARPQGSGHRLEHLTI